MNSFKPFGRRIQVRPKDAKGIIQTAEKNLVEVAEVVAVGDEVLSIAKGNTVVFTSYGVDSVDIDGERHYFLLEDDSFILATYVEG